MAPQTFTKITLQLVSDALLDWIGQNCFWKKIEIILETFFENFEIFFSNQSQLKEHQQLAG